MKEKKELKNIFTTYWQFLALRTACQLDVFDKIENNINTIEKLAKETNTKSDILATLIKALIEQNTIDLIDKKLILTTKGKLLTEKHEQSLKHACILWGEEHLTAWQNLTYTVKTGEPAFERIYHDNYFNYINKDRRKLINYHKAIAAYAKDDYKNITSVYDFLEFDVIADVGGGTGVLINYIAKKYPQKQCILFDRKEVVELSNIQQKNVKNIGGDFFNQLPFQTDAIILARVLHDWNDIKAKDILKNCHHALNSKGKLLIVEIMQDEIEANLLSLNMMLMTKSYERTFKQYEKLLDKVNFKIISKIKLNNLQTIITAIKK